MDGFIVTSSWSGRYTEPPTPPLHHWYCTYADIALSLPVAISSIAFLLALTASIRVLLRRVPSNLLDIEERLRTIVAVLDLCLFVSLVCLLVSLLPMFGDEGVLFVGLRNNDGLSFINVGDFFNLGLPVSFLGVKRSSWGVVELKVKG